MMTMLKRIFSVVAVLAIAGCGGGGGSAGTSGFGGTTPPVTPQPAVSYVVVQLSSDTIANSGTGTVTATVTALDSNRVSVSGASLVLSTADTGALITVTGSAGAVTDASGKLVATIGIGSNHTNRDIVLKATAGTVTGSATLKVIDSAAGTLPTSIEVIAAATTVGTGGDGVLIRAFVKDVNNNALPAAVVSFRTDTGVLSGVSAVTDASGTASATFAAGADKSNRTATITVTSGTVTPAVLKLPITGTKLTLSGPSSVILRASAAFDVIVADSKGNVVPNVAISATSSLGNAVVSSTGVTTTNASGQIRFNYTATNAGTDTLVFSGGGATVSPSPALLISGDNFSFVSPAAGSSVNVNSAVTVKVQLITTGALAGNVISFAATGGSVSPATATTDSTGSATTSFTSTFAGPVTVQASVSGSATTTTLPLSVVATTPSKLVLQITPTAIPPTVGTATGTPANVVAKVTDANSNPVQGQVVTFTRVVDPSGGNLSQASATTDSSGLAAVTYRAGSESTANNGVTLRATVASAPTVTGTASLTVNQSALFIALGTGNAITNLDPQTYRKDWVVYVTDSNGIPVNGVTLTIKAIPTRYLTGQLTFDTVQTQWVYLNTAASPVKSCRNEDANTNGVLDAGEDDNADGVLWPGNVISVTPGNVQTVDGRATVSLIYAESYAPWVQLRLTASATVAGTESRNDAEFIVGGAAEDFGSQSIVPAGRFSPFGTVAKAGAVCSAYTPP